MGSFDDAKSEPSMPGPTLSNARFHILVVEDEDLLREAICNSLIEDGYQVSQAASVDESMRILQTTVIHLIVLDLLLPGRDGFDFIRDLKASPETRKIFIIILTARDAIPHRVLGLDLGADGYMTKPFALSELKARIRAQLRQISEPPPPPTPVIVFAAVVPGGFLQFSRLRLEKAKRITYLQDEGKIWSLVSLTQREFDILWFLAENKGEAKTRAEILSAIDPEMGEEKTYVLENTIDVHIHNIRRKIGPLWIQTVYRIGFRFVDPYE